MVITSSQNPRVKQLVKLRDKRSRDKTGLFLIEGFREILRAAQADRKIDELYYCPSLFLGENEDKILAHLKEKGTELVECTKAVFQKISYRDRPDGLLAVAPKLHASLADLEKRLEGKKYPFLVVAESVEKPGNLGTMLRTCDAVGVDAMIVADPRTDIHNPNVVRASVGTLFTVPTFEVTSDELIPWLKEKNIPIIATTPEAETFYSEMNLRIPLALAFGTEQLGLTDQWLDAADIQVSIPMVGLADSLNVAISSAVLLYEVFRNREM